MILRKYLAWLGSTLVLVGLSTVVVPQGFVKIADWIGPLLGPALRPELYLFFLLAGPSVSYTPLLLTWVSAGLVGGLLARGILRSMAAGTMSVLTIVLLVLGNGLLMFDGIQNLTGGPSGFNLPPPPQGLSIVDILNAPIVDQLVEGATSGGGLFSIVMVLVANLIINLSLYAVVFTVSGFLFSKIFRQKRPSAIPAQFDAQPGPMPQLPERTVVLSLTLLLLLATGLVVPAGIGQESGFPEDFSGEQLFLDLQRDGSLRMVYSTNVSSLPGVPTDYQRDEFQDLLAGFLFAFNGSIDAVPEGPLSFVLPLLPPNGFLAAYQVSDAAVGRARADTLASEFGQGFGTNLQSVVSFDFTSFGGQAIPGGGIYLGIYEGDRSPRDVGSSVLSTIQDGVGTILTPEKVFVNQYGVLAGFVNFDFGNATATPSAIVAVFADLTPLGNFFGRGNFTLGLREVFGNQGAIGPSTDAKTTKIQLSFPANSTIIDYFPPFATVNATTGQLEFSMNSTDVPVSNVYVTFTGVFPQRIDISRQLDPQPPFSSGTTVTERITVTNRGNETIQGVVLSEKRLFDTYQTLQLLSPSMNVTLGDLPPLASAEATFQFRVLSDGVYTLPPTEVSYVDQGEAIRKTSNRGVMQSSFNLLLYLEQLFARTTPYSYLLVGLAVLPPVLELRKIGRRRKGQTGA